MSLMDGERLHKIAVENRRAFEGATPFPHAVIDDFLPEDVAERVEEEFFQLGDHWKHYNHVNENKLALTDWASMPPHTQRLYEDLQSDEFRDFVRELTGVEELISDPSLEGAGMHMTRPGGFLNVHTDFLTHTRRRSWRRRVNLLIYLNHDWRDEWNGQLELWTPDMGRCASSVSPRFNRCVMFKTLPRSYHGHPRRLACPRNQVRKSLAIYYYEDIGRPASLESTDYRPRPDDSRIRRMLIGADRRLLALYTYLKGRTGLSDDALTRLLARFRS